MADLTTSYMGLKLRNPLIVGSSDLTKTVSGIKKCEEAGAGAVIMKSIFEEQFFEEEDIHIHPEALDYMRGGGLLEYAPHSITRMIKEAKKDVSIPIIASINCQTPKLWPSFARQIQQAGADGLELNIYFLPIDVGLSCKVYEEQHLQILREVKKEVSIPVSVKLMSQITSVPYLANRLAQAGSDAIVLFNWFLEPDIDVKNLKTRSLIGKGNFSQSLRWIALLAHRIDCDLASSGGVQKAEDIVKQILAGASAVQVCTLFYEKGLDEIKNLLCGMQTWMDEHRYSEIEDFKGDLSFKRQELSFKNLGEAGAYFRAQYLKTYSK